MNQKRRYLKGGPIRKKLKERTKTEDIYNVNEHRRNLRSEPKERTLVR